jgi:hypothetical protein
MTSEWMNFMFGALGMACLILGVLFLRAWRSTNDRLFAMFAAAFGMLALERLLLMAVGPDNEIRPYIYGIRLLAFVGILIAIVDKNRKAKL